MSLEMTVDEVITELTMTSGFSMNLIVEGLDDWKFFQSCIRDLKQVNIVCGWGSDNVCEIVEGVDKCRGVLPTLGVIDRDYRIPLGKVSESPNIVMSDFRDIECMMFGSQSFYNVVHEFASKDKLEKFGVIKLRSLIIDAASLVGAVRFYSQKNNKKISFKHLELDRLVCKKTLIIEPGDLISHLEARQKESRVQIEADLHNLAFAEVSAAKCSSGEPYFLNDLLLCRGHDVMAILGLSLRSLVGTMQAKECMVDRIEQYFRLNYVAFFRDTDMAKNINQWIVGNNLHKNISLV